MHLGSRVPESDFASYTPRAQLFEAFKKNTVSGENIQSLLKESAVHRVLASADASQSLEEEEEEVDGMSPQSCFQISLPVLPHYASPGDDGKTKRVNISAHSQISFRSDDCKETSLNVQQMSKSLLFDQLKRVPPALPPDRASDKLSDSQVAETASQSSDNSGILHESSIRSAVEQIVSANTPSVAEVPELLNSSNSKQTEYIKYTPEKLTIRHKGSSLKRKPYVKNPVVILSRISQNIVRLDNGLVDDSDERIQCSSFKTSKAQQVSDASGEGCAPVLTRSTLVPASSVSHEISALDKTNNNRGIPYRSSEISVPDLLPSTEFLLPQNLDFQLESNSSANLFNRKPLINVRRAAPLTVGKVVRSSREGGRIQSSSDEVFESRPTSVERTSMIDHSGDTTDDVSDDQSLSKRTGSSKRLALHGRKRESLSLSSKGDPALSAENYLSSTGSELEGGPQNVVELDKWTIRLVSGRRLCLAGYKKDKPGGRLHCSDPVTRRLRDDMVETTSGMLYHLSGRLCKSTATEAGLSNTFLHSFSDGFPPNWEDLLDSALTKRSSRMPVSYSPVQKDLEGAMPLSEPEEDSRRSCELVKKVKSATATNKSSVAMSLSNKGSKNDPLTVQDLPVTRRSGRMVIPPLAWWANQRVMVDPTTNITVIAQENKNMLDLPAVHFKQRKVNTTPEEVGEELEERKKDFGLKEEKAAEAEKQLVETCSKNRRGRPRKSTIAMTPKMEIESSSISDVVKDRQRTNSGGGQLKVGRSSEDSVAGSRLQTPRCRDKNHSDEVSVLGSYDSRRGFRKREQLVKVCRSCSTSSVDTVSYRDQKRRKLSLKNYRDYQPSDFSCTETNSKRSVKSDLTVDTSGLSRSRRSCNVESDNESPQTNSGKSLKINSKRSVETSGSSRSRRSCNVESDNELPQTNSGKSLKINSKRSVKSDLTVETNGSSRSHRSCNVESDSDLIKVPVYHGTKQNNTLMLQDSKVIRNSEKQTRQNSTRHCHEKQLNRKENGRAGSESEGSKKTCSDSVVPSSHKTILRNENAEEKGRQKKLTQTRSPKVHSPSPNSKDVCSKLSSVQQRSRLNSDSEESLPAVEESGQRRTKKHSRKDLRSSESVELVYTKSERLQKMTVMRHDSKKSRERSTTDPFSFLTKSPLLMQGLPPKPTPLLKLHASGNLSDFCDSDDSANVEYFFSSDESEA